MISASSHTHDFVFKSIEKAATPGGQRNALEFSASSHHPGKKQSTSLLGTDSRSHPSAISHFPTPSI
jgi:hypothetical protein